MQHEDSSRSTQWYDPPHTSCFRCFINTKGIHRDFLLIKYANLVSPWQPKCESNTFPWWIFLCSPVQHDLKVVHNIHGGHSRRKRCCLPLLYDMSCVLKVLQIAVGVGRGDQTDKKRKESTEVFTQREYTYK